MAKTRFTRRDLFLATSGVALVAAGGVAATPACAALHQQIAARLGAVGHDARLAGNNIATVLRDLRCPGCGEPFIPAKA
jgi:hypothetical protein